MKHHTLTEGPLCVHHTVMCILHWQLMVVCLALQLLASRVCWTHALTYLSHHCVLYTPYFYGEVYHKNVQNVNYTHLKLLQKPCGVRVVEWMWLSLAGYKLNYGTHKQYGQRLLHLDVQEALHSYIPDWKIGVTEVESSSCRVKWLLGVNSYTLASTYLFMIKWSCLPTGELLKLCVHVCVCVRCVWRPS